jgi:periplasmic copper chaperone A
MIPAPHSRQSSNRSRISVRAFTGALSLALALVPSAANALFIVNQPWLLPAGKTQTTRAFMHLTSTDGTLLVRAKSDDAQAVTIHSARARAGAPLALPAARKVTLAPGGDHLTLTGLTHTLRLGDRVTIRLTLRDADGTEREIPVSAEVRQRSPLDDERRARHHH